MKPHCGLRETPHIESKHFATHGNAGSSPIAKVLSAGWRRDYNEARPHSALGDQTPAEFAARWRGHPRTPTQSLIGPEPKNGASQPAESLRGRKQGFDEIPLGIGEVGVE